VYCIFDYFCVCSSRIDFQTEPGDTLWHTARQARIFRRYAEGWLLFDLCLGSMKSCGRSGSEESGREEIKHQANTVMWVKKKYSTYLGMVYISYLWWFGVCRARVFSHCTFISQKDKRRSKLLHPSPSWVLLQTAWGTDITGVFFSRVFDEWKLIAHQGVEESLSEMIWVWRGNRIHLFIRW
jgi:hypothetical protein